MIESNIPMQPGHIYHVWSHANGDENIFRVEENYHYFQDKYFLHLTPVLETFAYCLLPNHFHLMVRVKTENEIRNSLFPTLGGSGTLQGLDYPRLVSNQFSKLFNGYAQSYNKKYDRKGSLFIPNFKRKAINSDSYYTSAIIYIHWNPIHHGFTTDFNEWPYSSWHDYMYNRYSKINTFEVMEWFGGRDKFVSEHYKMKLGIDKITLQGSGTLGGLF